jgi:uridine phosphorylase
MEAGVLLTLASLFGLRAGCLCVVSDRTPWAGPSALDLDRNMEAAIDVAHAALHSLASEPAEPDRAQRGAAERRSRGREEA